MIVQSGIYQQTDQDRFRLPLVDLRLGSSDEIAHVPGIGKRMAENIDEILATGKLQRLEELRQVSERTLTAVCLLVGRFHRCMLARWTKKEHMRKGKRKRSP